MVEKVYTKLNNKEISIESGKLAKLTNGSVVVSCGGTMVLAAVTMSKKPRENIDFFPLTVDYIEKMYASGKVPGGFFKREARPSTKATLTSRLTDRPLRPLFPEGFRNEINIAITILSYDGSMPPEILSMIGASAALTISDIPFDGPIGAVVVGLINGQLVINPSVSELEAAELELVVAGTQKSVIMIEAGSKEVSEEKIMEAIKYGQDQMKTVISIQDELRKKIGKEKIQPKLDSIPDEILKSVEKEVTEKIRKATKIKGKNDMYNEFACIEEEVVSNAEKKLSKEEFEEKGRFYKLAYDQIKKKVVREITVKEKLRADGRSPDEIRQIDGEVGILPCAHGSSLFTRGETQSLAAITLGTGSDEQIIDGLEEETRKKFYLHYNFPPFSVGEVGNIRRTGRRELGHGALAERSLSTVIPDEEKFPYTIRIVSEILESNGSSSMASVCSGSLALMDAGVPISSPVAGIAMGLIKDDGNHVLLTDIQGLEDHLGDMDFKVAGTQKGITALQMDLKLCGVDEKILKQALEQAKKARLSILDKMKEVLSESRKELSKYAPKLERIKIDTEKIGLVIGPGGKMIRRIIEESGAGIDIDDDGGITISSSDETNVKKAKDIIISLTKDVMPGEIYEGKVVSITNFGAFVELVPGKEGLLHISQIADRRIEKVEDELSMGQAVKVKVREIDDLGRINLTRKGLT